MTRALAALVVLVPLLAPKKAPEPPPPPDPPDAPPKALAVSRVEVVHKKGQILVVTDLSFEKTARERDWDLFVAYGAPGVPRGFEAELVPLEDGALFAKADTEGRALVTLHVPRAPEGTEAALGPRTLAGQTVRIPKDPGPQRLHVVRLRALHALPEKAADASVLVRISHPEGALPLGPLFVRREDPKTTAVASVCGGERLAIVGETGGTSPLVALRPADGELCVHVASKR